MLSKPQQVRLKLCSCSPLSQPCPSCMFLMDVHLRDPYKHLMRWGFHASLHTQPQSMSQDSSETRQLPWSLHRDVPNWLVMLKFRKELMSKDISILKLLHSQKAQESFFSNPSIGKNTPHHRTELHTDDVYPLSFIKLRAGQLLSSQPKQRHNKFSSSVWPSPAGRWNLICRRYWWGSLINKPKRLKINPFSSPVRSETFNMGLTFAQKGPCCILLLFFKLG